MDSMRETAAIGAGFLYALGGVACLRRPPYIKKQTTLTYRGDNSTSKYHIHKIFPEYQKVAKWIHKGGYSRPDKRTVKKGGKKK